jgi:hypothetical protein
MDMNINAESEIKLSLTSLNAYIKKLELKKQQIINATQNIATRIAEEAGKETYKSVKVIPAEMQGETAIAYVRSTDAGEIFAEFGTGIVGSQNPHVDEALSKSGWKYDVNKHGEKGWVYPRKDGSFAWTKGQPSQKRFYLASQRAKEKAPSIAKEELQKQKNK